MNVVTPIGGAFSYYTDWLRDDPVLGRNKWTTFFTKELPPLIDKQFGTTKVNAIAGISMAGTSVLNLAINAPRLQVGRRLQRLCAYQRSVGTGLHPGSRRRSWRRQHRQHVGAAGYYSVAAERPVHQRGQTPPRKVYMTSGSGLPDRTTDSVRPAWRTTWTPWPTRSCSAV